jgi:hypothetical protein
LRLLCKDDIAWGDLLKTISQTSGLLEINWTEAEVP